MKKNILRQKYDQKHARYWGFPGSAVITNLPSSAGDAGLSPDQGTRIPCASGQPSLSTAITEPACSRVCAPQATTRENPCIAMKTQHSQKKKKKKEICKIGIKS